MDMSTKAPTVFLVQESPDKNFIPALEYGSIQVLLDADVQIMFHAAPFIREMRGKLEQYTEDDYILAVGDPAAIAAACMIASERTGGKVTLLKWDRIEKKYYPVELDIRAA